MEVKFSDINLTTTYLYTPSSSSPKPNPKPKLSTTQLVVESEITILPSTTMIIRYRKCQRNHAAHLGSHVLDGCGEFMPAGDTTSPLSLKCAACDCHRNFHRREIDGETAPPPALLPPPPPPPLPPPQPPATANCYISFSSPKLENHTSIRPHQRPPVMMAFGGGRVAAESSSEDLNTVAVGVGQLMDQYGVSKKRFRTKFTQEQKDKMMEFADKIGWKLQKQDDEEVHRFCNQMNIKRRVFKVWLHNNKQAIKRKQSF